MNMDINVIHIRTKEILIILRIATTPKKDDFIIIDGKTYIVKEVLWLLTRNHQNIHYSGVVNVQVFVSEARVSDKGF